MYSVELRAFRQGFVACESSLLSCWDLEGCSTSLSCIATGCYLWPFIMTPFSQPGFLPAQLPLALRTEPEKTHNNSSSLLLHRFCNLLTRLCLSDWRKKNKTKKTCSIRFRRNTRQTWHITFCPYCISWFVLYRLCVYVLSLYYVIVISFKKCIYGLLIDTLSWI